MITMHDAYYWIFWVFLGGLGLCLGSFLNVVIWRWPRESSIIKPRSTCPHCNTLISWHDNIPLASFIFLRGKCRHCNARISLRYPAIEFLTAALLVAIFAFRGIEIQAATRALLALMMIATAIIDAEHLLIPDEISLGGVVLGIGFSFIPGGVFPLEAVIGAAAGAGIFAIIRKAHMLLTGIEGMGLGDVKLVGAIGAFLGWYSLPLVFLFSTGAGLLAGGILIIVQRKGYRAQLPFGAFLALGTVVYIFVEPWWTRFLFDQ